jgi:hypothetical protein
MRISSCENLASCLLAEIVQKFARTGRPIPSSRTSVVAHIPLLEPGHTTFWPKEFTTPPAPADSLKAGVAAPPPAPAAGAARKPLNANLVAPKPPGAAGWPNAPPHPPKAPAAGRPKPKPPLAAAPKPPVAGAAPAKPPKPPAAGLAPKAPPDEAPPKAPPPACPKAGLAPKAPPDEAPPPKAPPPACPKAGLAPKLLPNMGADGVWGALPQVPRVPMPTRSVGFTDCTIHHSVRATPRAEWGLGTAPGHGSCGASVRNGVASRLAPMYPYARQGWSYPQAKASEFPVTSQIKASALHPATKARVLRSMQPGGTGIQQSHRRVSPPSASAGLAQRAIVSHGPAASDVRPREALPCPCPVSRVPCPVSSRHHSTEGLHGP